MIRSAGSPGRLNVSSTEPDSLSSIKAPENRNPARRASKNDRPDRTPAMRNRPASSVVADGPSPGWNTCTPAIGWPWRSTTRPARARSDRIVNGGSAFDSPRSVIQSETAGAKPATRTTTR